MRKGCSILLLLGAIAAADPADETPDPAAIETRLQEILAGENAGDPEARAGIVETLARLHHPVGSDTIRAYEAAWNAEREAIDALFTEEALRAYAIERRRKRDWARAARHALAFINDRNDYPMRSAFPYHDPEAQAEGMRRVEAVRALWFPARGRLREPEVETGAARMDLLRNELARLEPTHAGLPAAEEVLAEVDTDLAVPEMSDLHGTNADIRELNETRLLDLRLSDEERRVLADVNDYREMFGLRRLVLDPRLQEAARDYARAIAPIGHFDHRGPDGRLPHQRAAAAGYPLRTVGENLAMHDQPIAETVSWWTNSPDHHREMLYDGHVDAGVGVAAGAWEDQAMTFCVLKMGRRR